MQEQSSQQVTPVVVGKVPVASNAPSLGAIEHRRAKHDLRGQVIQALTGRKRGQAGPGLVAKGLARLDVLLDSPDPKMALDAVDRMIRLLPYVLEREGEAMDSPAGQLAQALRSGANVQIVFGQHFHGRGDQALTGQAGDGQSSTSPGAMPGAMPIDSPSVSPSQP